MAQAHALIVIGGGGKGGIDALCLLLEDLPLPLSARILVAIDDPLRTAENMMMLLQGHTRLIVSAASAGEMMQPGGLYLAPYNCHFAVEPDFHAILSQGERLHDKRPAADVLFSSAAAHFRNQVIGVLLSGGTDDGVAGLRHIHSAGGLKIVQSPSTAENPGMPLWATAEDHPDFICAPQAMGPLLGQLVRGDPFL